MKVRDPICGMGLDESMIHSSLIFKGKEYYFDSESCESLFKKLNGIEETRNKKTDQIDIERKMVAYYTLKQLAATVAHYIRNANAAISAQAQLCSRAPGAESIQKSVLIIKKESEKIEAIVDALLSVSDIQLQKYVGSEEDAILDLRNTLEDRLREIDKRV